MSPTESISNANGSREFYQQRSERMKAEEERLAEAKKADAAKEKEAEKAKREEKKEEDPPVKVSISKEARELAAFHKLGNS
ncbi:MAG: hypothetical protein ACEPO8_03155 [Rhodothermaceae bacterium]